MNVEKQPRDQKNLSFLKRAALRKRRILWIGFGAVLIPLMVLMVLQYRWLGELERASSRARQADMMVALDYIAEEVNWTYSTDASKTLRLPGEVLTTQHDKLVRYLKKMSKIADTEKAYDEEKKKISKTRIKGASLFFVKVMNPRGMKSFYFNPITGQSIDQISKELEITINLEAELLHYRAWEYHDDDQFIVRPDSQFPLILNPLMDMDGEDRLLGVAGMVVDLDYFRDHLLVDVINHIVFKKFKTEEALVTVSDPRSEETIKIGNKESTVTKDSVMRNLEPLFPNWKVSISGFGPSEEEWARTNFIFNMSLSVILALVLISGIMLALRTASREMKLSEMKNDFVSNVSHELRTPLASIRVFGEFLRLGRYKDHNKVHEYGEYIETESRRLTQLINNILDFSKIESGQKTYLFEPADLAAVMRHALKAFEVRAHHEGMTIRFECEPVPALELDANAITQAFGNLVDNAIKYRNGCSEIVVGLRSEKQWAVIWVKDQGIGISPEEQEKIFDRFHRVGTGLVHDVKGSGLGLSIVKHIVEAHHGKVTVESESGKGSTFSIYLPLSHDAEETPSVAMTYTEREEGAR